VPFFITKIPLPRPLGPSEGLKRLNSKGYSPSNAFVVELAVDELAVDEELVDEELLLLAPPHL